MKNIIKKFWIFLIFSMISCSVAKGKDPFKYTLSLSYYRDLSDTYRGGGLFSGEFKGIKSWYGANIGYGHFLSQSTYEIRISVEELNKTIEIPIEEMAIMEIGTLSVFTRPLQNKWMNADLLIGIVLAQAKNSILESIYYNYSFIEKKFTYLYRDYQLIRKNHFGYQFGFSISFNISGKLAIELNTRIQDLSHGGTFFFSGAGLCFKL